MDPEAMKATWRLLNDLNDDDDLEYKLAAMDEAAAQAEAAATAAHAAAMTDPASYYGGGQAHVVGDQLGARIQHNNRYGSVPEHTDASSMSYSSNAGASAEQDHASSATAESQVQKDDRRGQQYRDDMFQPYKIHGQVQLPEADAASAGDVRTAPAADSEVASPSHLDPPARSAGDPAPAIAEASVRPLQPQAFGSTEYASSLKGQAGAGRDPAGAPSGPSGAQSLAEVEESPGALHKKDADAASVHNGTALPAAAPSSGNPAALQTANSSSDGLSDVGFLLD